MMCRKSSGVELLDRAVHTLSSGLTITGTVAIGTLEALMIAVRTSSRLTPPVEGHHRVGAIFHGRRSLATSSFKVGTLGEAGDVASTLPSTRLRSPSAPGLGD